MADLAMSRGGDELDAGDALEADLLVIGAGMAGMSGALVAARAGATVIVIDAAEVPGGSARLSGGIIWAPADVDAYCALDPRADPELIRIVVDGFGPAIESVRELGLDVQPAMQLDAAFGFPAVGHEVDLLGYLERSRVEVVAGGGHVATCSQVLELVVADGAVVGARASDRDGEVTVAAPSTILATGGFQGSRELRRSLLGDRAEALFVRSNATSDGAGLRLATAVGAAVNASTDRFYGNLLPAGMGRPFRESDFLRLSQFHSIASLLLDLHGSRIGDESESYYGNAWLASRAPDMRALLVGDAGTRRFGNSLMGFDRVAESRDAGAHVIEADQLDTLADGASAWGFARVAEGVRAFNDGVVSNPETVAPPRRRFREPLETPPYFAVEVTGGITFPFAGLSIDHRTRVLSTAGAIAGLFAAGADASVFHTLYGGGLAMAMTTGRLAAAVACEERVDR